jgi:hypothetical protein
MGARLGQIVMAIVCVAVLGLFLGLGTYYLGHYVAGRVADVGDGWK